MTTWNVDKSSGNASLRSLWTVCISLIVFFSTIPCRAQPAEKEAGLRVLMVEPFGSDPSDAGLFTAIRAQLSATHILLERVTLSSDQDILTDPLRIASRLARKHRAAIVFWNRNEDTCRLYYYVADKTEGQLINRTIDLNLTSLSARFEVIAVVASSMIEGLLVSRDLQASAIVEEPSPPPASSEEAVDNRRRWVETFLAYSGALTAPEMVSHGVTLGVGMFPVERLVIAVCFTLNVPNEHTDEALLLKVVSRQLELLVAGRVRRRSFDARLGLSWFADFRSLSTRSWSEEIDPRQDQLITIHSLVPFFSLGWSYLDRFGLFGRVGAALALNETTYRVTRDESSNVLEPYTVKLFFQLGMLIRI